MAEFREAAFISHALATLRSLFDLIDKDGSGFINRDELEELLKTIGRTGMEIRQALTSMDANADGRCSFSEFARWFQNDVLGHADPLNTANAFKRCERVVFAVREANRRVAAEILKDKRELAKVNVAMSKITPRIAEIGKDAALKKQELALLRQQMAKIQNEHKELILQVKQVSPRGRRIKDLGNLQKLPGRPDYLKTPRSPRATHFTQKMHKESNNVLHDIRTHTPGT